MIGLMFTWQHRAGSANAKMPSNQCLNPTSNLQNFSVSHLLWKLIQTGDQKVCLKEGLSVGWSKSIWRFTNRNPFFLILRNECMQKPWRVFKPFFQSMKPFKSVKLYRELHRSVRPTANGEEECFSNGSLAFLGKTCFKKHYLHILNRFQVIWWNGEIEDQ